MRISNESHPEIIKSETETSKHAIRCVSTQKNLTQVYHGSYHVRLLSDFTFFLAKKSSSGKQCKCENQLFIHFHLLLLVHFGIVGHKFLARLLFLRSPIIKEHISYSTTDLNLCFNRKVKKRSRGPEKHFFLRRIASSSHSTRIL